MKHAFVCLSQISRSRAIGRKRPTRHPNQKSKSDGFPAERVPDVDGDAFLFEDRTTQARFLGRLSVRLPGGWAEKSISRLVFCVRLRVDGCFPLRHIIPPCWDATILQCNGHEGAGEAVWGEGDTLWYSRWLDRVVATVAGDVADDVVSRALSRVDLVSLNSIFSMRECMSLVGSINVTEPSARKLRYTPHLLPARTFRMDAFLQYGGMETGIHPQL